MIEENKNNYAAYWLFSIILLICLIIVVGGLTRLTDSGLSITRWDLISGIVPPLNIIDWENTFSLYKKIPEYKLLNSNMTLSEFKIIYWWEYVHRLLGRIIGLAYILPLLYFTFNKSFKKKQLAYLYFIFLLICVQGFIGWFMVQSGLVENTDVSHYRLSLHLTVAFLILILLIWNFLTYTKPNLTNRSEKVPYKIIEVLTFLIILQISIGALVSGLDAGTIYQSWPLMNQSYFPDDSMISDLLTLSLFESPSLIQFFHRNLAYLIFLIFSFLGYLIYKNDRFIHLRNTFLLVFIILIFQIFLGVLTILSGAYILLASMHQIGSIFLISASITLIFKNYKV